LQLEVVYEDDDMAIVVKPWGIACYGRGTRTIRHVVAGFLRPSSAGGGRADERAGGVAERGSSHTLCG
jgi:23S rRNA-/tRNA-specific pseudouridylate synthase